MSMTFHRPSFLVGILFFLVLGAGALAEPLKAVSWNIEWFPGLRPNASKNEAARHVKAIQPELKKMGADIFLFQEITSEKALRNVLAIIPGMKLHVISKFPDQGGRPSLQQQAIASKLEAHSAWFENFATREELPSLRRGFAFAALRHPDGGLIMTYSVHLKSNHGSETQEGEKNIAATRAESVKQILAHMEEMKQTKFANEEIVGWIIGGDFNTNHENRFPMCTAVADMVAAGFHNTWAQTPREERLTWRSDPDPENRRFQPITFDYFFTQGVKPVQAKIIEVPRELSDHYPYTVELELQ